MVALQEQLFVVNVQILLLRAGEILLIERSREESHAAGVVDLPGGKLELTELGGGALEACAARELREETGVEHGGPFTYVTSAMFVADDGVAVTNIVMMAELPAADSQAPDAGADEMRAFWLPLDGLGAETSLPPWTRDYIAQGLDRRAG